MNGNKSNSDYAISYFTRLLALDIACFIMSLFVFTISTNVWLRAAIQLCDLTLLISVTYSFFYKIGDSDAVLVHTGHTAARYTKGLVIGCLANIPFFICGILLILSKAGVFAANFYNYYKIINSFFFPFLYTVMPVDMTIFEMHTGDFIFALLVLLIIPLLAAFSYLLGLNRFSFREKLLYKRVND